MTAPVVVLDPVLGPEGAEEMLRLRRAFGAYGMYSNEGFDTGYAPGLGQRIDAVRAYLRDRAGTGEEPSAIAARTNYFRETYAYGDEVALPGIEPFWHSESLAEAARAVHGRPLVEPAIVYANVYLPGQELAVHTDVPEFRGANRKVTPQWLLVVMHHSGLFDRWRMHIATAITYFGGGAGGALVTFPDGPGGEMASFTPRHDTGVVLDTDSTFHGVARVSGDEEDLESLRPGMQLVPGDGRWEVRDADRVVTAHDEDDLRFSVSWKAYCFADETERDRWRDHGDDLGLDQILDRLEADMREAGALEGRRPDPETFGIRMIDHYVRFPSLS